MLLFHGEHTIKSREALLHAIAEARAAGHAIVKVESKSLTVPLLEGFLGSAELFSDQQTVVIEELHSLPVGQRRTALIAMVKAAASAGQPELILWEKRKLTATQLKQFPQAKILEFKLSSTLFGWLDSLSGASATKVAQLKKLNQVLAEEDAMFCFTMLIRQIRMLLQLKTGGTVAGAPFMVTKLRQQAQSFTQEQLLAIHNQLLTLDWQLKTSRNIRELEAELGLLIWSW